MAKAKNPIPFTSPLKLVLVNINIAPPSPANIEAIIIPIHWYLTTLIPCESAAFGFSPIDTNLKPNLVNLITTYKATIKAKTRKKINEAGDTLDQIGNRSKQINRKLGKFEELPENVANSILGAENIEE